VVGFGWERQMEFGVADNIPLPDLGDVSEYLPCKNLQSYTFVLCYFSVSILYLP
jgi:hypothetical protein